MKTIFVGLLSLLLPGALLAQISEEEVLKLAKTHSPQWDEIESQFYLIQTELLKSKDRFQGELFVNGQYQETQERAIIQFQPIFSPVKQMEIGYRQSFQEGLQIQASVGSDQRSAMSPFAGTFRDVTTTIVQIQLQMDIWKDLWGKVTKAKMKTIELQNEQALLQKEIQQKNTSIAARRLYWLLVGNNEQIKVTESLLKTSQEQFQDAQKRFQNAIADRGEVARYEAQVASRKANLYYLQYQKEILVKQMRVLIPPYQEKELSLGEYNLTKTIDEVLSCTMLIASQKQTPLDFTKYDETINFLRRIQAQELTVASRYDGMDIKFITGVESTGVGSDQVGATNYYRGSIGSSWDDMNQNNRLGYHAGINVVIPMGSEKEKTQKSQELFQQKKYNAMITQNESQLHSTHLQLVKSIQLLSDVIKAQKENNQALQKRLEVMNQKFSQARVSVTELINDQDSLFNAQLGVIQTQNQILNTVFDYLAVFTETPCEFNRM